MEELGGDAPDSQGWMSMDVGLIWSNASFCDPILGDFAFRAGQVAKAVWSSATSPLVGIPFLQGDDLGIRVTGLL